MNFGRGLLATRPTPAAALVLAAAANPALAQDFNGDGVADLAVGCPMEDVGAIVDAGAVTIIFGAGPALGLSAVLPVPSMLITQGMMGIDADEMGDHFGAVIAWGDFNGDFFDDIAIAAPGESHPLTGVNNAGMVVVLYGMPGGPIPMHPPIIVQDPPMGPFGLGDPAEVGDDLGSSLAAGDFNADGFCDLAIGVPGEDDPTGIADVGIVHVLYGTPVGLMVGPGIPVIFQGGFPWGELIEPGDRFGQSLAAGDLNGDGACDLAIGVPLEDHSGVVDAGMVNIAYGLPGPGIIPGGGLAETWTQNSPSVPTVAMPSDEFGAVLAIGNFDGVLGEDLAVGMPRRDFAGNVDAGSVIVIYSAGVGLGLEAARPAGAPQTAEWWHQNVTGIGEIVAPFDYFGWSLAAADFNADQFDDLAIGAPGEDIGAAPIMDAGCVHIIYGAPAGLGLDAFFVPDQVFHQNSVLIPEKCEIGDQFGISLTAGDYDVNWAFDLCVGAPFEDLGGGLSTDRGCVISIYGNPGIGLLGAGPVPSQLWHQNVLGIPDVNEGFDQWGLGLDFDD